MTRKFAFAMGIRYGDRSNVGSAALRLARSIRLLTYPRNDRPRFSFTMSESLGGQVEYLDVWTYRIFLDTLLICVV
jgi:hypothetical protein